MHRSSARMARVSYLIAGFVFFLGFTSVIPVESNDVLAQTVSVPDKTELNYYPPTVSVPTPVPAPQKHVRAPEPNPTRRAVSVTPPAPTPAPVSVDLENKTPARLVIPSIGLNAPIVGVGVNAAGEMAVPSGKSNNVGWYTGGPTPGEIGAAVLDAHVFAAFSKLRNLKPGDDIYVVTAGNQTLHFVVSAARTFALSNLSSDVLFTHPSSRDLNLITCAGSLTPNHATYDHRLIVYTTLVS